MSLCVERLKHNSSTRTGGHHARGESASPCVEEFKQHRQRTHWLCGYSKVGARRKRIPKYAHRRPSLTTSQNTHHTSGLRTVGVSVSMQQHKHTHAVCMVIVGRSAREGNTHETPRRAHILFVCVVLRQDLCDLRSELWVQLRDLALLIRHRYGLPCSCTGSIGRSVSGLSVETFAFARRCCISFDGTERKKERGYLECARAKTDAMMYSNRELASFRASG